MVWFWLILVTIGGILLSIVRSIQSRPTVKPVKIVKEQEETDPPDNSKQLAAYQEQLDALYYQLDVLKHLQTIQGEDAAQSDDIKQVRAALTTERQIHTCLGKIRKIESIMDRLQ